MTVERRKAKVRRKLLELLPLLKLYARKKNPKEIGQEIGRPAWWVRRKIRSLLGII
jgi:hypothetical protein